MLTRIYVWRDGAWREAFKHHDAGAVVYAFVQATGGGIDPEALVADVINGTAVERTDRAGVRGLVCTDDSPHRPTEAVAP